MSKTKRNVLITLLSTLAIFLISLCMLTPAPANAKTSTVKMPDTKGYFETPLVKGIDLSNKVVRFYYDDQTDMANGVDLGAITFDDRFGLFAEGSVYIDIWDNSPIYRNTNEYFEIYLDVDYLTSEITRLMIEDESWTSEADANFDDYFLQTYTLDKENCYPDLGETSAPNPDFAVYVLLPVPDTSKYIETESVDHTTSLKNKVIRVYDYAGENILFEICADYLLFENSNVNDFNGQIVPINKGLDYVDYYFHEDVLWAFFQSDDMTPDDFLFSCVLGNEDYITPDEDYKGVWVLEAPEETEEPDNSIEDEKTLDKWAGWVNDQTGWALTGSSLGIIAVAVVIIVIIKRK